MVYAWLKIIGNQSNRRSFSNNDIEEKDKENFLNKKVCIEIVKKEKNSKKMPKCRNKALSKGIEILNFTDKESISVEQKANNY